MRAKRRLEARVRKLERALEKASPPATQALDYEGAELVIDARTPLATNRANPVRKEPFTVAWIESLASGAVLYDIGANVGGYSLIAARRSQGALRVVAVEPGYANFAALCTNVGLNGAQDEVMPFPVTLGAETGLGTFRYRDVAPGAALHAGAIDGPLDAAFTQPVLVFALDDLVERFGLPAPEHVKLDVDGAEVSVLRGAPRTLASERLRSLMVELSDDAAEEADALLAAAGLRRAQTFNEHDRHGARSRFWYALYER